MEFPKTLQEFQTAFPDEEVCWTRCAAPVRRELGRCPEPGRRGGREGLHKSIVPWPWSRGPTRPDGLGSPCSTASPWRRTSDRSSRRTSTRRRRSAPMACRPTMAAGDGHPP